MYDRLEKQYKTSNPAGYERLRVGSDQESSYPEYIRALALYLALREKPQKPNEYTTQKPKNNEISHEKGSKKVKRIKRKIKVKQR